MLDIMWGGIGILCGVAGASLVQGFNEAKLRTRREERKSELFGVPKTDTRDTPPEIMVKLIPAANGRLLEVSTKKVFPGNAGAHWEWEHEMFIVEEGQKLSEAIAMVMLMKGLEK